MPEANNIGGYIGRMVEKVRFSKKLGTCAGVIRVTDLHSGNENESSVDRFVLTFPYGGLYLKWEVIFNINHPEQPPDFIFLTDVNAFNPDIYQLKSLLTWNSKDDEALLKLLQELLEQYKQQQLTRLVTTALAEELQELIEFKEKHNAQLVAKGEDHHQHSMELEVFAGRSEEQVHIMTRVPVFLPNLSNPLQKEHEKMLVLLTYAGVDGMDPVCQVFPSPKLEKTLLSLGGMCQPPSHRNTTMLQHVSSIVTKLKSMVEEMRLGVERRKAYVEGMVSHFCSHVVEYNSTTFQNASFLFLFQDSLILLTIDVPFNFPTAQPSLSFASMMRHHRVRRLKNYPYSPRWSPNEMAARMRKFLEENLSSIEMDLNTT